MKKFILLILVFASCQSIGKMDINKWIDLNRFKEANTHLLSETSDQKLIVFMGDSITEGWDRYKPDYFENPTLVNRGISGQTSHQMLLRFQQDVISLNPKMVIINCGTNDIDGNAGVYSLKETMSTIRSMTEIALANKISVVLSAVLPCDQLNISGNRISTELIIELNTAISDYCAIIKIPYLDYHTPMKDKNDALNPDYTYDAVHPDKEGYVIMESVIESELGITSR